MVKKMRLGGIAFLVGIVGSLLLGLFSGLNVFAAGTGLTLVLIISGLIIGFLNISAKEAVPMMIAVLLLGISAGVLSTLPFVGIVVESMLASLAKVVVPAGLVVAVKVILAKAQ